MMEDMRRVTGFSKLTLLFPTLYWRSKGKTLSLEIFAKHDLALSEQRYSRVMPTRVICNLLYTSVNDLSYNELKDLPRVLHWTGYKAI